MMDQEIVPYSAPDMASLGDVAQSVGSGLLEGAGAALDIPRRVGRALGDAINYEGLVADALGVPPEERAGFVQGARSSVPPSFTEMARDAIPPVPGMEDSILFSRAPKIVGGAAALGPVASAAGAGGLVAALGAGGAARGYEDAQRAGAGPGATLAASAGSAALDALGVLGPLGMAARGGTSLAREVIGGGLVGGVQSLGSQALAKATYSPEQEISYVRALDEALANAVAGGILSAPEAMAMREAASSRAQEGTTAPARSAEESGISERTEPSPFPLDQGALALDPLLQKATSPTGVYVNPEGTSAQPFAPDAVFAERAGLRFPREPRMEPRVRRETVAEARPETPEFLAAEQARADRLAAMESLRSDPVTAALADQARAGDHRALERLQDEARMIFTDADLAFLVGKRARPSEIDGPAAAPPARPAPADTTSQTALPAAEVDAGAPSPKPSAVEIVTKGSRPSLEQREAGRALPRRLKADLDAGRVLENVQRAANGEDVGTTPGSLVSPDASLEAQAMRAGVRETRAETPGAGAEPVSREAQETAALELVRREGPEALGDRLVGKVRRGTQQLLAHEQVALGRLAQERALAALNSGDPAAFERATLLEHAYQNARAEAGRGLGVIRSPQTPQEAVAQALLEPTRSTRLRIEKLQKARRDEIARLEAEKPKPPRRERIAKVEADI
ncbi:MAG TPA: hypothetical protein VEJ18_04765, partial [Planctomycetota bacterium]|nr:hypothetical protein [Planctomycetota bacterium]